MLTQVDHSASVRRRFTGSLKKYHIVCGKETPVKSAVQVIEVDVVDIVNVVDIVDKAGELVVSDVGSIVVLIEWRAEVERRDAAA